MNYFNFSYQFFCVLARILPAPMKIRKRACFKMDELFMIKTFEDKQPAPCAPLKIRGRAELSFFLFLFLKVISNLFLVLSPAISEAVGIGAFFFPFKRAFLPLLHPNQKSPFDKKLYRPSAKFSVPHKQYLSNACLFERIGYLLKSNRQHNILHWMGFLCQNIYNNCG